MLGGLSQQRVSQLVRAGEIVAEPDENGALQYDRESVHACATRRAAKARISAEEREERRALHEEARDRFTRERKRLAAEKAKRDQEQRDLHHRAVVALERIAKCLSHRST